MGEGKLPNERAGVTHAFKILNDKGTHRGYITVGQYEDGTVGEIFVKMDRQGSEVSGLADAWAIAVSKLLQKGVSLDYICDRFRNMRFEPAGVTDNPRIRFAHSPVDYIAQWLYGKFVDPGVWEERGDAE